MNIQTYNRTTQKMYKFEYIYIIYALKSCDMDVLISGIPLSHTTRFLFWIATKRGV